MISSPDLRIDAAENSFACCGRSGNALPRLILIFVAAKENGSACSGRSSNEVPRLILIYVAAKGDCFVCYGRSGNALPRPILIYIAAKENSSACSGLGGNEVRVRFHSSLPRRRMVPPAERHYPTATVIPDFRG